MKNTTQPTLQIYSSMEQQDNYSSHYMLKWRQGQLLVSLEQQSQPLHMIAFESEQQLVECLKHSPVKLVCLDPALGEVELKRWADACEQASQSVFLRGRVAQKLPKKPSRLTEQLQREINRIAAFLLLLLLSPVMLATVVLMCIYSPGSIFSRHWRVGARGQFFRILKFRTTVVDDSRTTRLGRWMCKYGLDELPQLLNVLRGEMSLFGPSPLTLSEVVLSSCEGQRQLNTLLPITDVQPA